MKKLHIGENGSRLAAVALLAGLGLSSMAVASPAAEHSYVVDATGLNQNSADGAAILYARLRFAAESVCGLHEARGYAPRRRARRCVDQTLQAVVTEVGGGLLKARHNAEIRLVRRSPGAAPVPTATVVRR